MKMFRDGITPFVVAKLWIGRSAVIGLILVAIFLALHILSIEKEMSSLRREQIQLEKFQNKVAAFNGPQTLLTLSVQDGRNLAQIMRDRTIKSYSNGTFQTSLNTYVEYLNNRGEMSTFMTLTENINSNVSVVTENIKTIFPTLKGPSVVITFSSIKRVFENIQKSLNHANASSIGHEQFILISEILPVLKETFNLLSHDKNRLLENAFPNYKSDLVTPTELLIEKLNTLQNKNSFVASQTSTVLTLSHKLATMQERITDAIGVQSAYIRLGHEHVTHVSMMLSLVLFGMAFFAVGRIFSRHVVHTDLGPSVAKSDLTTTITDKDKVVVSNLNSFLAENMVTATAVTDTEENISWASNSFYQTLGLDPSRTYNWNQLLESHIIRSNSALGISGAVSVLGRPGVELKLASKTPNTSSNASEKRILEIVPIYNYQVEMQKTIARLAPFTDIPGVDIYEAGETISEVSSEISYLFQTTDTLFKVEDERPIYIAFDKVLMRKNMKTLMTGLLIYLSTGKARRLTVTYQKVGDVFSMTFTIPGHKFKEVTAPLVFRDKTYPSLSAYLEEIECAFQKYSGRVVLKNVQKDGQDDALITWELTESDEALFNLESLEKKRRIHRVVKTAEKVKDSQSATTTKANNRKQNSTLGPKDFQ